MTGDGYLPMSTATFNALKSEWGIPSLFFRAYFQRLAMACATQEGADPFPFNLIKLQAVRCHAPINASRRWVTVIARLQRAAQLHLRASALYL